jgi:hypothetical protein
LISLAAPAHRRIGTVTIGPPKSIVTRMMRVTLDRHPMPLLVSSIAVKRECESCGLVMDRASVMPVAVQHDAPGIKHQASGIRHEALVPGAQCLVPGPSREELRRRWGTDDSDFVVGLLCEPKVWADAPLATAVLTRLRVSGRSVRLVMSADVFRRADSERWARHAGTRDMLVFDDAAAEPWRFVQGLDAALSLRCRVSDPGTYHLTPDTCSSPLPVMWAMAAGVPVVAEADAGIRQLIEDGVTGVLMQPGDANAASKELARLHDERSFGERIGIAAARHAREHFCISRYCTQLNEAYDRAGVRRQVSGLRAQHDHQSPDT